MSDCNKWMLKQPGFIDWKGLTPGLEFRHFRPFKKAVEWDGTMNMPILDLADNMHIRGSKDWNLN